LYAQAYTLFWDENFKVTKKNEYKYTCIKRKGCFLGGKYDNIHLSEMIRLFRNFTIEYIVVCMSLYSNIDFLVM
jgi:hypothetical protein